MKTPRFIHEEDRHMLQGGRYRPVPRKSSTALAKMTAGLATAAIGTLIFITVYVSNSIR